MRYDFDVDSKVESTARESIETETIMAWTERIAADPSVCGGKPCIRGTRIMVSIVLSNLAAGISVERIIENYPRLTREDIQACLEFAAELAMDPVLKLPKSA